MERRRRRREGGGGRGEGQKEIRRAGEQRESNVH